MITDRHQLYESFLERYPIDWLPQMTLQEYTDLVPNESFCNWVESKTEELGSIWGSNAFKFGIFRYKNIEKSNPKIQYDDKYAWYTRYARYGASDAMEAFKKVRTAIAVVATAARNHDLDMIESVDVINGMYKWKIAFLYSDKWLIPIYKQEWLRDLCINFGMDNAEKAGMSQLMKFLIERRGDKDVFEYYDELIATLKKIQVDKPAKEWLYAPGEGASQWERCLRDGVMLLGWDDLGDYSRFTNRDEIVDEMRKVYDNPKGRFSNDSLAVWEFAKVMKPGDTVYAKKGLYKIVGRGIVEGEYEYNDDVDEYLSSRKVRWTDIGEWDSPQQLVQKTLTDISKYPDYVESLEGLFDEESKISDMGHNKRVWLLIASPKTYTFADKPVGAKQVWTLYNDNNRKRNVFTDMEAAKEGDIVVCYDSNPSKRIVALARVSRSSDGKEIEFEKIETLFEPVTWQEMKDNEALSEVRFIKSPMGVTFCGLSDDEADSLLEMIRAKNPELKQKDSKELYLKEDFLQEVFMTEAHYDRLESLLRTKQNVILQGAPGVGKTYSARRLAYSIMGEKDDSRIEMVQFHQNYSYEDFIMGFKPQEDGSFRIEEGRFYKFCKRAELDPDPDRMYFFIIDEINRGNLSKIFGELLMLIEKDYRGYKLKLAYRDEEFSVPKNLYIIGMMNTADRSLAMIDYALRRRFSFFEIVPGFESTGFREMLDRIGNERLNKVIDRIIELNGVIESDDSLGKGFCIGHSYFCFPKDDFDEMTLRNVIEYDIQPMLAEYWFDDPKKAAGEIRILKDLLS